MTTTFKELSIKAQGHGKEDDGLFVVNNSIFFYQIVIYIEPLSFIAFSYFLSPCYCYYSDNSNISSFKTSFLVIQLIYSIKLPGNPKLGEGKPENQNHAIIFTRGNAIQTIDMNQVG